MDNMAYLQQISGGNNNLAVKPQKPSILSKIFNIKVLIGVIVFIVVIVLIGFVGSMLGKVDTKDRDLMQRSYWQAKYFNDVTATKYGKLVKDSQIRNMSASLVNIMNEIQTNGSALLKSEYGIDMKKQEKSDIAKEEKKKNTELNTKLEDGRLNATLDRIYLREVTMQIAYAKSYQSEIMARTKKSKVKEFSKKVIEDLDTLYSQFRDYKNLAM